MEVMLKLFQNFWLNLQSGQLPQMGFWTYVMLAAIVAVEGPIATLLGAAMASAGYLRLNAVFFAAMIGNLIADLCWYLLGYLGKVEWVMRFGKRFGLRQKQMDLIQKGLADHAPKLLIAAKLTAAFTIPTLIAAGLAKLPLKRWLPGYVVAEAIWTGALVLVGYYATEAITRVETSVQNISIAAGALFVIAGILYLRKILQRREFDVISNDDGQL